jgi:hypothetical protein
MKLSNLAAQPQLVEITLDDEATVEAYGEPLTFMTWDRQPIDQFMRLAAVQNTDPAEMIGIVKDMILDDAGQPVLTAGATIPATVLTRAITKIVERLGK